MGYFDGQYCPKCGYLVLYKGNVECRRCWPKPRIETLDIPSEYKLGYDDWRELVPDLKDDEAFEKAKVEWDRRERFFYEDFLVKQPGFDPNLYWYDREKEDKLLKEREEKSNQEFKAFLAKREGKIRANNPSGVKCSYCGSNNCKKISAVSRGLLGGLFGVASPALGNQWHCNNCGSKF